jgi:hypothetical protein
MPRGAALVALASIRTAQSRPAVPVASVTCALTTRCGRFIWRRIAVARNCHQPRVLWRSAFAAGKKMIPDRYRVKCFWQ